jgi:hypothetical protein
MFAVKASRYLTHVKRLTDLDRGFMRFYEPLKQLIEAGRLGPVLWQFPENSDATMKGCSAGSTRCQKVCIRSNFVIGAGLPSGCSRLCANAEWRSRLVTIPSARFSSTTRPRRGGTSTFTTERGADAATTRRPNLGPGHDESRSGTPRSGVGLFQQRLGGVCAPERDRASAATTTSKLCYLIG